MSDKSIHLAEIQLLNHLIRNPLHLDLCENNYFITEIGKDLYNVLISLHLKGVKIVDAHILSEASKVNAMIDTSLLAKIRDVDVEDEKNSFEFYYFRLKEEHIKNDLTENKIPNAIINLAKKGKVNHNVVDELIEQLESFKSISSGEGRLKSFSGVEAIDYYEQGINDTLNNPGRVSTGCSYLDANGVEFLQEEITVLFSNSGSGKSTTVQNILEGRMLASLPFVWYITEMGLASTMNRVAASTSKGLTKRDFKPIEHEGEYRVSDKALDHIRRMKRKYGMRPWRITPCDQEPLTLDMLEEDIPNQKRLLGLKKEDNLLICIDLLSMVVDLTGDAATIEAGMNKLSFIAKKHKVHILGVVQAKEKRGHNISIKVLNDVFKYKPVLEDIKNSSAFTERSRTILMSFRPMNIINKFDVLKNDPCVDLVEDVLYLTILKSNNEEEGKVLHYFFDGARANLKPYPSFAGWDSQFTVEESA